MTNSEKFRPGSAVASGWILIAFFSGFIIQTVIVGGDFVLTLGICGAGAFGSYLLFLKPYVLLFDENKRARRPTAPPLENLKSKIKHGICLIQYHRAQISQRHGGIP